MSPQGAIGNSGEEFPATGWIGGGLVAPAFIGSAQGNARPEPTADPTFSTLQEIDLRPFRILSPLARYLIDTLSGPALFEALKGVNQIGPGERTVLGVAHQLARTHRKNMARANKGRWFSGVAASNDNRTPTPFITDAYAERAARRMNRAVQRMQRLELDASSIPNHIKQNASIAHKQLAR